MSTADYINSPRGPKPHHPVRDQDTSWTPPGVVTPPLPGAAT